VALATDPSQTLDEDKRSVLQLACLCCIGRSERSSFCLEWSSFIIQHNIVLFTAQEQRLSADESRRQWGLDASGRIAAALVQHDSHLHAIKLHAAMQSVDVLIGQGSRVLPKVSYAVC
jgi:hypothetical protein